MPQKNPKYRQVFHLSLLLASLLRLSAGCAPEEKSISFALRDTEGEPQNWQIQNHGLEQEQFNVNYKVFRNTACQSRAYEQAVQAVIDNPFSLFLAIEFYLPCYPTEQLFYVFDQPY